MRIFWLFLLASSALARAATLDIHYAPAENLEAIDVALINDASASIDMAAYVLTDPAVIEALSDAADRGVQVRLYLDRGQFASHASDLASLAGKPMVEIRVKPSGILMHLKAYALDGARLRTGSANFSISGLSRQDNDLLVTDQAAAIERFQRDFAEAFAQGAPPANAGF